MDQQFIAAFPISELTEHPDNPRRGNLEVIAESMNHHGFYGAVVVQASTNQIIVGNHRTRAAAAIGEETVPVLVIDVDDEQAKRIMLADNRSNDLAGYDDRALFELLASLDGDLAGTGFMADDVELLLAKLDQIEEVAEPQAMPSAPARVKPNDVWRVGPATLVCADSRRGESYDVATDGEAINLGFTSPPYADRRRYAGVTETIKPEAYVQWFQAIADNVRDRLAPDGSWFVNIRTGATDGIDMETYVLDLVLAHHRDWGWHWASEFCWERQGVPKQVIRRFKGAYEMVYHFCLDEWKFRPDAVRHYSADVPQARGEGSGASGWEHVHGQPGHGAYFDKNVKQGDMAYPSNRLPTFAFDGVEATGHPAAFPIGLPRFFVLAYSDPGDLVIDPFAGSGSTLLAAVGEQRRAAGIEISPSYCDITLARLSERLHVEPELVSRD